MAYSVYFQAVVQRQYCWKFVALLKSFEHLAFDRTLDNEKSIFEFYVPEELVSDFKYVMKYFEDSGLVKELKQLPNRIELEDSKL